MQDVTLTVDVKRVEIDSRVEAIQNLLDRRDEIGDDRAVMTSVRQLATRALEWC